MASVQVSILPTGVRDDVLSGARRRNELETISTILFV